MIVSGSFSGEGPGSYTRRFYIEASLSQGQIVAWSGSTGEGDVTDPTSVNDFVGAIGVLLSKDLTYSTVTGSGGVLGDVSADPLQKIEGRVSGTTAAGGGFTTDGTDSHIITVTAASATVITAAGVGTSDAIGGQMIGLSGTNKGQTRRITSHSDNTSETVINPFDKLTASGDTFLRTYSPLQIGVETTSDFVEFAQTTLAGENYPNTGEMIVLQVLVDGSPMAAAGQAPNSGLRNLTARVVSETAPEVAWEILLMESIFGTIAGLS